MRMRLKGGVAIVALMVLGVYATTQIFGSVSDISGIVYHDYNGNGKQDNALAANPSLAADRGMAGITVKGFAADGTLCDTQTSDANGAYTLHLSNCSGPKFRVEFSGMPAGYSSSQVGVDSKTTTQFVAPGGVASLGVYRSSDYCQNNPKIITSCIRAGAYNGDEADEDSIYGFLFNTSNTADNAPPSLKLGKYGQVGTSYAQAYRPASKSVYSAAYLRRHDGFGPGGPGAIYRSQMPASGTGVANPALFVTIPNAGGDPHPVSDTNCNSVSGQTTSNRGDCWAHDEFAFDSPGKTSLGGMAVYKNPGGPSGDALLVVNMNDRKLYKVTNLDAAPTPTGYTMPTNLPNTGATALPQGTESGQHKGCVADDVRPFAVTIYDGTGYVGFVCSAQTSRSAADLRAYVYSFDPATMTFATAPTLEVNLNYERSCAYGTSSTCNIRASWMPWISQFSDQAVRGNVVVSGSTTKHVGAPQPTLADISFAGNGSMTLGFRDRYVDQMGYEAKSTNHSSSQRYTAEPAGDLVRACKAAEGGYVVENAGTCGDKGPGSGGAHPLVAGLPQGIGGYEFYSNEYFKDNNKVSQRDETSLGAIAQIPGYDSFANTSINPIDGYSQGNETGGMRSYNSNTGDRTNAFRIYANNPGDSFLKGNNLGDVDFVCDSAPIEIGNRVWNDTNGNGIQDATEPGIGNVTVTLRTNAGVVVSTALTDVDGNYLFSNRSADENGLPMNSTTDKRYNVAGLMPNTGYKLTLSTPADYTDSARLKDMHVTTADVTANNGNDQNDSDSQKPDSTAKVSAANPATITFTTGGPGANDHTLDFGFDQTVSIGNFVWLDSNKNGKVDPGEENQGINGVKVNLYAASADTNNDGSLSVAEIGAATPVGTKTTATDTRPGSTSGRPGYYQFDGLSPGGYFVAVDGSNFSAGQPLQALKDVPVPTGVGDTQDDNTNHGAVPDGGTLAGNGVVSTLIDLQPGAEPTVTTGKSDDDASADSDLTIDFGFWHSYSLGNRVWLDKDNSATVNAADGASPGIEGVKVRLMDANGTTQVAETHTDAGGYYRFDNLNAGTYIVEIASSNFEANGALHDHALSSIAVGEETDPDNDVDSNDNGINPIKAGDPVRSGTITLGPGAVEPKNESDLSATGQGNDDDFANMTVDFGFIGTTSWGDTVFWDIDGDGTQDPGDPGIPNVTVTLVCGGLDGNLATAGDNTTETKKTDLNGNYLFVGVLPGPCKSTVTTTDVPGGTLTTPGVFTHTIVGETSFLDADYGFKADGSIGNQVWKEVFANGTYDTAEGDTGIEGVKVELYRDLNGDGLVDNADIKLDTRTTDGQGHYQFINLPTDDNIADNGAGAQYVVKVVDPDHKLHDLQYSTGPNPGADNNSQNPTGYGMVLTPTDKSNQTGDFGYHGLATVGDTVWYDTDNSGTQDPTEPLLPGIKVTLTWPGPDDDCTTAGDNQTKDMITDANGNYLFTNLLGGKYCISIEPPVGTTITTNNQGEQFTLGPTQVDLTRDFGVIGDGTIGNQVFIDGNNNGKYDGGDTGIEGVTIDLIRDLDGNGVADAGEPVLKTTTTDNKGQYGFDHLITGDVNGGVDYVVVVTDTNHKLANLTHVNGNGTTDDNESKDPAGFGITLTPSSNNHPEADFGYKSEDIVTVNPPKFWKHQEANKSILTYTLTWINQSTINGVDSSFYDTIPDRTSYVADSLKCEAKGSSSTDSCVFNSALNRIEWAGKVGTDFDHPTPNLAVNPIVVTFQVEMDSTVLRVENQAFGKVGTIPQVPSDWDITPQPDDPTVYVRTPETAAVVKLTGGVLANTGQVIWAAIALAAALIIFSTGYVMVTRRRYQTPK